MRPLAVPLAAAIGLAAAAPLHADEWTLIDVRARLANDGRVTVVETHHVVLETTGRSVFHEFGRGADQDIRLTAVTRIGPDGEPHRLRRVDAVDGPDEYTYYPLGHAHYSIPSLGERVSLQYRFEYELTGAVAPWWAIAAGPGSRAPDGRAFVAPWTRARQVVADWRRAWPAPATRYRFDHDVLLPDRGGRPHAFRQIDYRLEYDSAWRDIDPKSEIGAPAAGAYRAARTFDYLGSGQPAHAATAPAALRILSLLAVPIAGLVGLVVVVAAARARRAPSIDRTFVESRFLTRAPEEIAWWLDGSQPTLAAMLSRLAGEGAIGIHVDRGAGHTFDGDDDPIRLHMRRVAPDAQLTSFERAVLDDLFGGERELTNASHYGRHAGKDFFAGEMLDRHLRSASAAANASAVTSAPARRTGPGTTAPARRARWTPARVGMAAVLAAGLMGVLVNSGPDADAVPAAAVWALLTVTFGRAWPSGWWYPGRPVRGLLLALALLHAMQVSVLLMSNRPLPAEAWGASALAALAAWFLVLARSRLTSGDGGVVGDLQRMRAYAAGELQRARPQLDDRWIPRLQALGLGEAIDAWRSRYSGAGAMPPEMGDRPQITTAIFTGRPPATWNGPAGWVESLDVHRDAEHEGDEDEHADDAGPTGKVVAAARRRAPERR